MRPFVTLWGACRGSRPFSYGRDACVRACSYGLLAITGRLIVPQESPLTESASRISASEAAVERRQDRSGDRLSLIPPNHRTACNGLRSESGKRQREHDQCDRIRPGVDY